jgi:hypothetical protein
LQLLGLRARVSRQWERWKFAKYVTGKIETRHPGGPHGVDGDLDTSLSGPSVAQARGGSGRLTALIKTRKSGARADRMTTHSSLVETLDFSPSTLVCRLCPRYACC